MQKRWGGETIAVHGQLYLPSELPGFIAFMENEKVGLATYRLEGDECELVTLDSLRPGMRIGTALVEAVSEKARQKGCWRLWLVTTNDNLDALRFYQRRGFRIIKVHPGAVDAARRLKPQISEIGEYGIPIHDEIECEKYLDAREIR